MWGPGQAHMLPPDPRGLRPAQGPGWLCGFSTPRVPRQPGSQTFVQVLPAVWCTVPCNQSQVFLEKALQTGESPTAFGGEIEDGD